MLLVVVQWLQDSSCCRCSATPCRDTLVVLVPCTEDNSVVGQGNHGVRYSAAIVQ
jgi:hypothetical protein